MSSASENTRTSNVPAHVRAPVPPGFGSIEQWWAHLDAQRKRADDAAMLAGTILACCGVGSVLEVGCGDGALLRAMASRGCDARGVDVSADVVEATRRVFPCAEVGDVRSLNAGEGDVDTVVAIDVLHHLEEHEVAVAIAAIARAARSNIFLRISTLPVEERPKHRTSRPREWWQQRCFEAGLRTHPRAMLAAGYDHMDSQAESVTLVLEKVPTQGAREWPLARLAKEKQLHMDMLREPGRRADAHVARYMLASGLVRPGDTVLDVACGLGYGAHVIAQNSRAARVTGIDIDAGSIAHATALFGDDPRVEFRAGDAMDLSHIPDASVDLVVSFETLEHVPDPQRALREFERVLTPGGRLIASVPNDWTDESGTDPNPHHLHVYTWDGLADQVRAAGLLIERAQAQTAGGGMKHTQAPRRMRDVRTSGLGYLQEDNVPAEWWLITAMKDPLSAAGKAAYRETVFPVDAAHAGNVAAFARDYDNPWLVRSMVSIGQRATGDLLFSIAARAVNECRAGSPDMGAAMCVLGYRLLDSPECSAEGIAETLNRVRAFDTAADPSPHAQRWKCSCWFVVGRLLMSVGGTTGAREAFEKCVGIDVLSFSPLLATKTVEAFWWLGVLAAEGKDLKRARGHWRSGMAEAQRAAAAEWRDVIGDPESPLAFGLPELSQVLDQASRCAWALGVGEAWLHHAGLAWSASAVNAGAARAAAAAESSRWRSAWEDQMRVVGELIRTRDSLWEESQRIAGDLSHTREEAERLQEAWRGQEARVRAIEVEKARMWEDQRNAIAAMEAEQARVWEEKQRLASQWEQLRAHNAELQSGLDQERALRGAAEAARDENWRESQRLAAEWKKTTELHEQTTREYNALHAERDQLASAFATLQTQAAEATSRAKTLEQRMDAVSAERDRAAREYEAARARLNNVEHALHSLRQQLETYRAGLRYRALRAVRIVHEVPPGDAGGGADAVKG